MPWSLILVSPMWMVSPSTTRGFAGDVGVGREAQEQQHESGEGQAGHGGMIAPLRRLTVAGGGLMASRQVYPTTTKMPSADAFKRSTDLVCSSFGSGKD